MATIKRIKGGFNIKHTTREVFGVDDPSERVTAQHIAVCGDCHSAILPGVEHTIEDRTGVRYCSECSDNHLTVTMAK